MCPIHSRDVWAFGNMMLQTIEDMNNEGKLITIESLLMDIP